MQNNTIPQPTEPNPALPTPEAAAQPTEEVPAQPSPLDEDVTPQPKSSSWKGVASTIAILLSAPLIAIFLTSFVFQSYEVDGPSMLPTLNDNDRLIVLKTGKTWSKITGKDYIPARGDIVIFHKQDPFSYTGELDKQLIKRVIALPGERVLVNNGILLVFNNEHPDGFQPDKEFDYGKDIETTPGNAEFTVAEGQVFVSGDNRTNSLDSREFGPIESDEIVGVLALRIFPLNAFDKF